MGTLAPEALAQHAVMQLANQVAEGAMQELNQAQQAAAGAPLDPSVQHVSIMNMRLKSGGATGCETSCLLTVGKCDWTAC